LNRGNERSDEFTQNGLSEEDKTAGMGEIKMIHADREGVDVR